MNNEELIKENALLKDENEKLKKQLEKYNNSRKSYYEKNKETVKDAGYKCEIWVYNRKGVKIEKYE
jgi:regulator of replication initiation timing